MKINFHPAEFEPKWQAFWEQNGIYQPDLNSAKRPYYNLMMFPYPSAEGLHVGNVYAQTGSDIYGRFKRMQGWDVFEPMGLDGFGIHSENYALKVGTHPKKQAAISEKNFYKQMHAIGTGVDWSRAVETYDPDYYKWTQWLFIQLFKAGLAYKAKSPVNYCPLCKTVLADEQVIERIKKQESRIKGKEEEISIGVCERCETPVEKKELEQWFFRITNYAERLLNNLEKLNWSEKVKIAQKNWIGKKNGINITYKVEKNDVTVTVFTTRPDTNFGATFVVIAPEHPLVKKLTKKEHNEEVKKYIEQAAGKSEIERQAEGRDKTGVFTGSYAVNQLTGYKMPIWVSDYVLMGFGTGIVVGVPGHDKRDFEFASKFGLEIIRVVIGSDGDTAPISNIDQVQEEEGKMINSGFLNGLDIHTATEKVMDYMEEKGYGKRQTTYHLRDWLISRQRYWGPPIPMIFCSACNKRGVSWFTSEEANERFKMYDLRFKNKKDKIHKSYILNHKSQMAGWYPVPEEQLPVLLPDVEDWKPKGTGSSPLANIKSFVETVCPECGGKAARETDVSDTFLDSAWYFLRYLATDWNDMPFPSFELAKIKSKKSKVKNEIEESRQRMRWLPVTMYFGGAEHSVLHLLYARFVTMVLDDLHLVNFEEPFTRFYAHGLIIKDGAKMSKSKGNVVVPDEYIKKFGADTLRTYLMFLGPVNQGGDFRDTGIEGMYRFLKRVWTLFHELRIKNQELRELKKEDLGIMHKTIKGVTEDLENLRYNTAIAKLMTWYNVLSKKKDVTFEEKEVYLKLLAPFAPFMAEELYKGVMNNDLGLKNKKEINLKSSILNPKSYISIHTSTWPVYDPAYIKEEVVKIPVQVNGKLRGMLVVESDRVNDGEEIEKTAKEDDNVSKFLRGKIRKVIYVPGKVLNFVVS